MVIERCGTVCTCSQFLRKGFKNPALTPWHSSA
jgi:hypothetical protein